MLEKGKKKPEIIFPAPGKPHGMRDLVLRVVEILHLYTSPISITGLKKMLESEGYQVHRKTLSEKVIKDIANRPTPGFMLVQTFIVAGANKQCPAYKLVKIKHNGRKKI